MGALARSPLAPDALPTLPPLAGVTMAAGQAGIRYANRTDVLLVALAEGTTAAGVFTRSKAPSAPVDWCRTILAGGTGRALVVNSGNANAFTGRRGVAAVEGTAQAAAAAVGCSPQEVYLASTGVIGEPLDYRKIAQALPTLHGALAPDSWADAAAAIMTTDTFPKAATRQVIIGGQPVTINGIAKGSGMIAPDMATMLAFVFTDAKIAAPLLQHMLQQSNAKSFNAITVDGDTSTSDTALMFATGASGITPAGEDEQRFLDALTALMIDLAKQVVMDGEGAQKLMTIAVKGAESDAAAHRIGLSIGNSPLVKTAVAGEDANWGRIVMAVGKSGERVDRDRLAVSIGGVVIARDGERVEGYDEAPVAAHMKTRDIRIAVDIGLGGGEATIWTCDLTHGYIDINADYRS
ncbi:MAG: bifunctional glutamate N-acetyltransferase/amino-acid acetyltransferase ArgJ [Alphaproteobacteria bacterium]|nr:bifunctional glutamate N-acetyltransferase/amino-acid acetyltransferase ArgJ [Alphaproteobacteria bacterium]